MIQKKNVTETTETEDKKYWLSLMVCVLSLVQIIFSTKDLVGVSMWVCLKFVREDKHFSEAYSFLWNTIVKVLGDGVTKLQKSYWK